MVKIISWFLSNGIITSSDVPEEATGKRRKMYSRVMHKLLRQQESREYSGMKDVIFFFPLSAHRKRSKSLIQLFLNTSERIYSLQIS